MEKIDLLRSSIKQNENIDEAVKCNIATLTDTLVTVFPNYNYEHLSNILSNLKIFNKELNSYSQYDKDNNTLYFDTNKIFEDRIDMQHLFLQELLKISVINENKGFNNGMSERIASLMNNDESMKKLYPLEMVAVGLLSSVVEPGILIDGYMNNNMESIVQYLESIDIEKEEFQRLINKFDTIDESFDEVEIMITNMYAKKIKYELDNGLIEYDDISTRFDEFEELLVTKKSDLVVLYPYHDFSKMNSLDKVKRNLDNTVINIEDMQMIDLNEKVK